MKSKQGVCEPVFGINFRNRRIINKLSHESSW